MKKLITIIAISLALTATVSAKTKTTKTKTTKVIKGKDKIIYKKNTILNFDGNIVDGEVFKPKGFFFQGRKKAKFKSLIKYRSSFLDKMNKSARKL